MPARELQSSSLGFSPPQPERSPPQPIASAFGVSYLSLRFPRVPVDAETFWVVSVEPYGVQPLGGLVIGSIKGFWCSYVEFGGF